MRTRLLVTLLLVLLFAVPTCFAQDYDVTPRNKFVKPYVESMVEGGDGYEGAGFVSRPGVELWLKNFNVNLETALSTTDKIDVHSGTTYRVNTNGYFNFAKYFLAGGGYTWGKLTTSEYTKRSAHPYVTGGVMCEPDSFCKGMRITTDYLLAGTDTRNGVRGPRFHFLFPMGSIRKNFLFLNMGVARYSAFETDCPTCKRMGISSAEFGFRIQR
jgi:hypothetical protein